MFHRSWNHGHVSVPRHRWNDAVEILTIGRVCTGVAVIATKLSAVPRRPMAAR